MKAYLDTDVVISSMISSTGAAYYLIHHSSIKKYLSQESKLEIEKVATRLSLSQSALDHNISQIKLSSKKSQPSKINSYGKYVFDRDDAHIVAGAVQTNVDFLITYNTRDYKLELIKQELDIMVMKPGMVLQYLRSK